MLPEKDDVNSKPSYGKSVMRAGLTEIFMRMDEVKKPAKENAMEVVEEE